MIDLHHHGSSVCAAKVRFALGEKGLAWQSHYLEIHKGDQFAPDYLKLNPKAVVPTLVHDGHVIVESTVINEYLDEVFPNVPLKPKDPQARAVMRVWTKAIRGHPSGLRRAHLFILPSPRDQTAATKGLRKIPG
jgi:glutathione S-transferase